MSNTQTPAEIKAAYIEQTFVAQDFAKKVLALSQESNISQFALLLALEVLSDSVAKTCLDSALAVETVLGPTPGKSSL